MGEYFGYGIETHMVQHVEQLQILDSKEIRSEFESQSSFMLQQLGTIHHNVRDCGKHRNVADFHVIYITDLFCLAMNIAFKQIWELGCETWPNVSELVLLKTGPRSLSKGYGREAEGVFVICHLVDWIICRQLQGFRGKQQG
ncbi:hypothetical protein Bca52824_078941 [Brassica carinata]|uniref:Uncharacterized protein n=1 Tax=Brassica carinata TaxID=52824 RepID=A0A8X7PZC2_BRACI|nr:hypothetical protein Bca52824_078941 [Brassica carinata]